MAICKFSNAKFHLRPLAFAMAIARRGCAQWDFQLDSHSQRVSLSLSHSWSLPNDVKIEDRAPIFNCLFSRSADGWMDGEHCFCSRLTWFMAGFLSPILSLFRLISFAPLHRPCSSARMGGSLALIINNWIIMIIAHNICCLIIALKNTHGKSRAMHRHSIRRRSARRHTNHRISSWFSPHFLSAGVWRCQYAAASCSIKIKMHQLACTSVAHTHTHSSHDVQYHLFSTRLSPAGPTFPTRLHFVHTFLAYVSALVPF